MYSLSRGVIPRICSNYVYFVYGYKLWEDVQSMHVYFVYGCKFLVYVPTIYVYFVYGCKSWEYVPSMYTLAMGVSSENMSHLGIICLWN